MTGVDTARIERAVRELLLAIGEDPDRDELVRTPACWRIRERRETLAWSHNFPAGFEVPQP